MHTISNHFASITLDDRCAISSCVNSETGTDWAAKGQGSPIFEIRLGDPSSPTAETVLSAADFLLETAASSERSITLAGEHQGVYVELSASLVQSGQAEWRLRVLNRGEVTITEVLFPILSGLVPPGDGCGFTLPANNGFWLPYDELSDDESITWNYPIFGSMQWVDFGGREEGIYIGCHDDIPLIKLMTAGRKSGAGSVMFRFTDTSVLPGESIDLPSVFIGPHTGDWRAGACIYRDWCESWMEKPEIPDWVLRKPHWAWMGVKGQHAKKPERTYDDFPRQSEAAADHGVSVLLVAGWLENGHDTHYPDYVAGDSLGGEEAMIDSVRAIHSAGRRMALYTNGRIADPDGSLKTIPGWKSWAVQGLSQEHISRTQKLHANYDVPVPRGESWDPEGKIAKEYYGIDFVVMCPSSREWREHFIDKIAYMVEKYEVDGVYFDQICGCWALPCYSYSHDHHKPNQAWGGYIDLLESLRTRLREINPEIFLATEGVGDVFGQYFDMLQGHNDWDTQVGDKSRPMPELFRFTLPWLVVCTGPVYNHRPDLLKMAHLVGSGYDFCTMPPERSKPEVLARSRMSLEWREQFHPEMSVGEFLGPCETSHPDYRAFVFRGDERTVVTLAWMPWKPETQPPDKVEIRVPFEGQPSTALLLAEDGEDSVEVSTEQGTAVVGIPFKDIGVLVIQEVEK